MIGPDRTLLGLGRFSYFLPEKLQSAALFDRCLMVNNEFLMCVCLLHYRYYNIDIYTNDLLLFLIFFGSNCNEIATSFARTMQW